MNPKTFISLITVLWAGCLFIYVLKLFDKCGKAFRHLLKI